MQFESLPSRTLVLLGMGHTHAHVLKEWASERLESTELVCIASSSVSTYSGMLPGVLAGQYAPAAMELDLVRLCATVGATLLTDPVTGVDAERGRVLFEGRPPLAYDLLSIGIGSVPATEGVTIASDRVVFIKPMVGFLERLRAALVRAMRQRGTRPVRVVVVGGGAGGLEVACCVPRFVERVAGEGVVRLELAIVHGSGGLPNGFATSTQERLREALRQRAIVVHAGSRVSRIDDGIIHREGGASVEADVILWATHAAAPPLLSQVDLPKDERGFLRVDECLRSTSGRPVFAVGDTASFASRPLAKAGVYAVREGPVLWENLKRQLRGQPLQAFRPQKDFLRLLNLGDGTAVGEYAGRVFAGRWVWRWKDRIDRRFMEMFSIERVGAMTRRMAARNSTPAVAATGARREERGEATRRMRCVGCGGKVSSGLLSAVMAQLKIPARPEVLVGLDQPDDAAVLRFAPGQVVAATTDFFTSPVPDHYLAGRVTALHALSDAWAMGAEPVAALATVVLPEGTFDAQYRVLLELLSGSLRELQAAGATLVGGHTVEGPQVSLGFTILAQQDPAGLLAKQAVRPGDRLVLTKALGVGTLLRAFSQGRCEARWWESMVAAMLVGNGSAVAEARRHGVRGATDVTGFGLAGHLLEMLRDSGCGATLHLPSIPLLPGAAELWREGGDRLSTMDQENRAVFAAECPWARRSETRQPPALLFDPQTCGGLLMSVPADQLDALLVALHALPGLENAACIGTVVTGPRRLELQGD